MRKHIVDLYEAKTNLSRLVERVSEGEEIVLAKAGVPKARLVTDRKDELPLRLPGF